MKILEWVVAIVLWICGAFALLFLGWCVKGYCVKKSISTPLDKAEASVLEAVEERLRKKE